MPLPLGQGPGLRSGQTVHHFLHTVFLGRLVETSNFSWGVGKKRRSISGKANAINLKKVKFPVDSIKSCIKSGAKAQKTY
jgi:hypothetical protein